MIQPLWRTVWRFLKKLKIVPYDPVIQLLGIYSEKTIIQKESCATMFIAAVFTMARTWEQPKCPSTDEWIKKMWYTHTHTQTHTMKYYSAMKKGEILQFATTWMDFEGIMLSEISQMEKDKHCMVLFICGI